MEALLREYVRAILLEEPGRSYHTPNMTPIDMLDQEGLKVTSYYDSTVEETQMFPVHCFNLKEQSV